MKTEISQDTVFDVLGDGMRRRLLGCLAEHGGSISLPDAAQRVTAAACGDPIAELNPEEVRRIYLELYHTHVPKLVEAGVVHYSQVDDQIELTEVGEAVIGSLDRFRP